MIDEKKTKGKHKDVKADASSFPLPYTTVYLFIYLFLIL